eukprot:TRINITY_DN113266_c0_g1_i1.p1 TRINITY_DN113266_c0_g1~~TRINITY_DN113266_c0_g1_i1.p1  ORF type:complete len:507 (-),score=56.65 TRINITY_DN113266_c0_g1_i1:223-1743(-)
MRGSTPDWEAATTRVLDAADSTKSVSAAARDSTKELQKALDESTISAKQTVEQLIAWKVHKTRQLQRRLEQCLGESQRMHKRLAEVKEKVEVFVSGPLANALKVARMRAAQRAKRPSRERINDKVQTALEQELQQLGHTQEITTQYTADLNAHMFQLAQIVASLNADLQDKNRAVELDAACLGVSANKGTTGVPVAVTTGEEEAADDDEDIESAPSLHPGNEADRQWVAETMSLIESASTAMKDCEGVIAKIKTDVEKRVTGMDAAARASTEALNTKIKNTAKLQLQLNNKLRQLGEEKKSLDGQIADTKTALEDTKEPLAVVEKRLALRQQRPAKEDILDSVSVALSEEKNKLQQRVSSLTTTLEQLEEQKKSLMELADAMKQEVHEKSIAFRIDQGCLQPTEAEAALAITTGTSGKTKSAIIAALKPQPPPPPASNTGAGGLGGSSRNHRQGRKGGNKGAATHRYRQPTQSSSQAGAISYPVISTTQSGNRLPVLAKGPITARY